MDPRKKKVLILSIAYFPKFVGGAEVALKEITDRLGDKYEFDMVTLRFDKNLASSEKLGSVNIFRVGLSAKGATPGELPLVVKLAKILAPFSIFWRAWKLHRKNKYDLIWSMMANQAGFAGMFLKMISKKTPLVLSVQEGNSPESIERKVRYILPMYRKIFSSADVVQPISNFLAGFAQKMGGSKIVVVPNGVDVEKFSLAKSEKSPQILSELGVSGSEKIIITASRLVNKNGIEDLIRSLVFLPTNVKLLILGAGPLEDNLKRVTENLGLFERVIFKGQVTHDDLVQYFAVADIFCRPSLSEGLGNVFLEAMASKLPVAATPVGGIVDIVVDRKTGLLAQPGDPRDLASKIDILLNDEKLRLDLVKNGFEMVSKKYDWNIIAQKMDEIFNSVKVTI
ncbi:MAG TPA: glycosyltransferase family 4 protein [Candidatus Paceibacterota bacterium]|nr:glycosyltransferase family 4 protein [Candidatus Paceibacterota bacterium]HRZ34704.1 glycosyltransferase family 4 protein [Candidatus Paceibacterota bacterium]